MSGSAALPILAYARKSVAVECRIPAPGRQADGRSRRRTCAKQPVNWGIGSPGGASVTPKPKVIGAAQAWYSEEGWGVLGSPEVEGTVFASFAALNVSGYRDLQ